MQKSSRKRNIQHTPKYTSFLHTSVKIPSGLNWYHRQLLEKYSCRYHHFSYSCDKEAWPTQYISGASFPPQQDIYTTRNIRRTHNIIKDSTLPRHENVLQEVTCESCYYLPLSFKVKRSLVIIWRSAHRMRACSTLMICLRCCSLNKQRCTTQMTSHLLAQAGTLALFQPLGHLSRFVTLQSDQGHKNTITLIITAMWMTCQYRSSQINHKWINDKLYRGK